MRFLVLERRIVLFATALFLAVIATTNLTGCATSGETETPNDEGQGESTRQQPWPSPTAFDLAATGESVRTIQLYSEGGERRSPVVPIGSGDQLALEFDLMVEQGRPLSVYFYHADRSWRRDLSPSEYLDGFRSDDVLEYERATAVSIPYVHYSYRFPNNDVDFLLSGNYVVRVTEQGQEEEVLFERVFFVTERAGTLKLDIEKIMVSGQDSPSDQPIARYQPPQVLRGSSFDYSACFVRNGRLRTPRCVERAQLVGQPVLQFEVPLGQAYEPVVPDHILDLTDLSAGSEIAETDRSATPYEVFLEEDYARFAGSSSAPLLNEQIVVREAVTGLRNPETEGEYALVHFRFVPPRNLLLSGEVVLDGSFTSGGLEEAPRLRWQSGRGRYEGRVLLKQGLYQYRYVSPDPRLQQRLRRLLPPAASRYGAFIYYNDTSLNTDRLLAVEEKRENP